MVYVFLAEGFEEIEALATVDILRRCGLKVETVGVGKLDIKGAHNITVLADTVDFLVQPSDDIEAIVLPGGVPGTPNEEKSEHVQKLIDYMNDNNKLICAICAAPSILGHKGLLNSKKATCYPGYEDQLGSAECTGNSFEVDGNIVTGKGAGCTFDFAFAIGEILSGKEKGESVRKSMQCKE